MALDLPLLCRLRKKHRYLKGTGFILYVRKWL